jgi:hypothetical protein
MDGFGLQPVQHGVQVTDNPRTTQEVINIDDGRVLCGAAMTSVT